MQTTTTISPQTLFELFGCSILRVSQVIWELGSEAEEICCRFNGGGCAAVFVLEFEHADTPHLLVASTDTELRMSLVCDSCENAILKTAQALIAGIGYEENPTGLFDLESVICPVPDWEKLQVTRAVVVAAKSGAVIGLCVCVNFGLRIGFFVAPFPGATLSFNDTCDAVLEQATAAQENELLRVFINNYNGKATPEHIRTLDWFDWLRK